MRHDPRLSPRPLSCRLHGRARQRLAGPGAPGRSVAVQPPGPWRTQRVRRRTARRAGPDPGPEAVAVEEEGEERDPADRRRHGRLRDHRGAQLRARRGRLLQGYRCCAADRPVHPLLPAQGQRPAGLRDRFRRLRHRLDHRGQVVQRRDRRGYPRTAAPQPAGAGQAQRQGHRQRLHRRAAGRHPRRPARPRHRSQVLRSRGHQQAVPEQCPGERRRRLDHRAVAEDPP